MSAAFPHVTEVLRTAGLVDASWFTETHKLLGQALHAATVLLDEGVLDPKTVDSRIAGRLAAYEKFVREMRPEIIASEDPFIEPVYRYQGTRDRVLVLNGQMGVLDIKPEAQEPWHGIQLAAYVHGLTGAARWSLHCSKDGRYVLIPHQSRDDWPAFLGALSVHNWKLKRGLVVPEERGDGRESSDHDSDAADAAAAS